MEKGFRQILKKRQEKTQSLLCVGLDPLSDKVPVCVGHKYKDHNWQGVAAHMMEIVDATAPFASMFKLQSAHYEAIENGRKSLHAVIKHICAKYPDMPVFLDCKRGDISRTQARYREAHFGIDGVDGMNFNPYMGRDCMAELVDKERFPGRAIVGLCRTSNKEAWEIQDLMLFNGRPLWEAIAEKTLHWAEELGVVEDAGLVMGAAYKDPDSPDGIYSQHLLRCREIVGDKLWFLIPGVGAQGGFVEETIKAAFAGWGSMAVNSSSGIIFASVGDDFAEAAAREAEKLKEEMEAALDKMALPSGAY